MIRLIRQKLFFFSLILLLSLNCTLGYSQLVLALKDIPGLIESNLPKLQQARSNAQAAENLIDYEKRSLMPNLNLAYQANISTFNNITGMSFPGLFMPISGPPSANNDLNFVPGSALTALLTWQPLTFGQRTAAIDRATAQYKLANASYNEQSFRQQYMGINTYLDALYFAQLMSNNRANIDRYNSSLRQTMVFAKNGLKPGVDTVQLQSARAQAEIDLLQNENHYKQKLILLSNLLGLSTRGGKLVLSDSTFNSSDRIAIDASLVTSSHPLYVYANAQKEVTEAHLDEVEKMWRPKLDLWSNMYGRGSGISAAGDINRSEGFNLSRHNIGLGFQLSFPILQFHQVNAKKKQYEQMLRADEYNIKQTELDLNSQVDIAVQQHEANGAILRNTALRLRSAEQAFNSLKVSYEAGLVDYLRLAQAQYELQQAETSHSGARLNLERSLLDISVASGNLNLFFNR